jgi:hypothetical protein
VAVRNLCGLLRHAGHGFGQFRPSNRSMSQLYFSAFDSSLIVRDALYLMASADQIRAATMR